MQWNCSEVCSLAEPGLSMHSNESFFSVPLRPMKGLINLEEVLIQALEL
jgi:hypothetical protein